MSQLSEQEIVRREKLSKLRELGINPYPADLYPVTHHSANVKSDFSEGKNVVIIDDVLYSGRSVRAALTALQSYGRPENIELLVLIDRRFSRHLPIQPDYRGRQVDAINEEKVLVTWNETHKKDAVYIEFK